MSISRAFSWPLLGTTTNQRTHEKINNKIVEKIHIINDKNEKIKNQKIVHNVAPQVQARKLLCRHYYPEGGWGWVIAVVGTLVHLLGSGVQLSVPATLTLPATIKFHHQPLHTAGKLLLFLFSFYLILSLFYLGYLALFLLLYLKNININYLYFW